MMAGNPSWWSMVPPSYQQPSNWLSSSPQSFLSSQHGIGSSSLPLNPLPENHEPPQFWSQQLLSGLAGDEDKLGLSQYQSKKLENWEDQILNSLSIPLVASVKQEVSQNSNLYGHVDEDNTFHPPWSHVLRASSPRSCVTSSSRNILDFSYIKEDEKKKNPDQSSECNSSAAGGMSKKARVQPSANQPPLKVRKEKLGDRITALHQLVSPFGKTDTASVLLEAIGYIRFLQGQIEALSSPYLGTASSNNRNQQSVQGEGNSVFPEDPGQLLNDIYLKRKGAPSQDSNDTPKDLRSRGLCLVPVTCTHHVGSEINGADFWAPAIGGGF